MSLYVTAIIPTRGDVDLDPVVATIPQEWQTLAYDNGAGQVHERNATGRAWTTIATGLGDCAVFARYLAAQFADNEIIYTQDDDVVVSDPAMIALAAASLNDSIICNMPREFRHDFYVDHALVGFGAAYPAALPMRTFEWFNDHWTLNEDTFGRTCDIIFTGLNQRLLTDVPVQSLPYASDDNRMWKQADHFGERMQVLEIVKRLAGELQRPRSQ